jgi:hypothetical protein
VLCLHVRALDEPRRRRRDWLPRAREGEGEGEGEGDVAAAAAAAVDCFGRGWRDGFLASAGTVHAEGATERRLSSGLAAAHSSHTIPA